MPSNRAAPCSPETPAAGSNAGQIAPFDFLHSGALKMRSVPSSAHSAAVGGAAYGDARAGFIRPATAVITARSITFSSSRTLPGQA